MTGTHVPDRIGRYEVLEYLGRGGMGVVCRGRDTLLDREVAIKVMHAELFADESARERFFREARAAARLQHRNIVTVFEFAEEESLSYIIMEFLRGRSLAARLADDSPVALENALDIVAQLASGLHFAHAQGVVHRDVKPANIWLQTDGTVKLLDFGIATLVSAGSGDCARVLGSVPYLAPEQIGGKRVDGRADIFSTGIVLYELLSGKRPFEGDSPTVVMMRILQEDPPPLVVPRGSVPAPLAGIVKRALEKDPDKRYASAGDLAADLRAMAGQLLARAPMTGPLAGPVPVLPPFDSTPVETELHSQTAEPAALDLELHAGRVEAPVGSGRTAVGARPWWATAARVVAVLLVLLGAGFLATGGLKRLGIESPDTGRRGSGTDRDAVAPGGGGGEESGGSSTVRVSLLVTSDPPGAAIAVDGIDAGQTTPSEIQLDGSRAHRVRLTRSGYQLTDVEVTAEALQAGSLAIQLQEIPRKVTFIVTGAYEFEIVEGNRVLSPAADRHVLVLTGRRMLRLRAPQYLLDFPVTIDAASAERIERRVPELGTLVITLDSALGNCRLSLGPRDLGYEPFSPVAAAAGTYEMALICPDAPARRIPVVVDPGESKRMSVR